ncbi:hypothetical protein P692DRAFT_20827581 [Suillus brevipes Sb2]|nr:hypothetical protein P692DRAFT_20827581 [Suillus brevipes Sb2]
MLSGKSSNHCQFKKIIGPANISNVMRHDCTLFYIVVPVQASGIHWQLFAFIISPIHRFIIDSPQLDFVRYTLAVADCPIKNSSFVSKPSLHTGQLRNQGHSVSLMGRCVKLDSLCRGGPEAALIIMHELIHPLKREQNRRTQSLPSTMTLLLHAVLFCAPAFVGASLPSLNDACIHTIDAIKYTSHNTRTLWDILLSCGLTLFACTWTAIHTNVPGMDEGMLSVASRRLFIMVVALIAPELIITWATRQFFSARRAAKDFNTEFGTQHARACDGISGHTAMSLSNISETSVAPRPAEIQECRRTNSVIGYNQDTSEIAEANRGPNSESVAPSSPEFDERRMNLEFLGHDRDISEVFIGWKTIHGFFAWMGGFMLYIDGKPRATLTSDELRHFVRVGSVDMPVISEAEIEDRSKGDGLSKGIALLQLVWFVIQLVARRVQNLPITLLEIDTLAVATLTCVAYGLWWKKPKDVGCPCIVYWNGRHLPSQLTYDTENFHSLGVGFLDRLIYPFTSLMGIGASVSPRAAHSRRVPSLGGYSNHYYATSVRLIGCFSGMVFGAIHCLGWNYLFQRPTEHMLWRAASLGIASAPALLFVYVEYWVGWRNSRVVRYIIMCVALITSIIYIAARVTLIVLIMLSLRSLPLGAYDTVAWTQFISHL